MIEGFIVRLLSLGCSLKTRATMSVFIQNCSTTVQKAHSDCHMEEEWIGERCTFFLSMITSCFSLLIELILVTLYDPKNSIFVIIALNEIWENGRLPQFVVSPQAILCS